MSENVIEITDSSFDTEVAQSDIPVLVDFWAEWCGPCRMIAPTIEELADEYKDKIKFGKIDTDKNRDVPVKFDIQAIPTIILFNKGEIAHKFVGLTSKDDFKTELDALVA